MRTGDRFEQELRLAAYRSLTKQLIRNGLIHDDEAARIKKRIAAMEEALIRPDADVADGHRRAVSAD